MHVLLLQNERTLQDRCGSNTSSGYHKKQAGKLDSSMKKAGRDNIMVQEGIERTGSLRVSKLTEWHKIMPLHSFCRDGNQAFFHLTDMHQQTDHGQTAP